MENEKDEYVKHMKSEIFYNDPDNEYFMECMMDNEDLKILSQLTNG